MNLQFNPILKTCKHQVRRKEGINILEEALKKEGKLKKVKSRLKRQKLKVNKLKKMKFKINKYYYKI